MTELQFSTDEILREAIWRECVRDELAFLENQWHIPHPARGKMAFKPFDAQREALEVWARERYSLTLKARQIGWTTLAGAHSFWLAFFTADQNILFISRGEREATEILKRVKYGYKALPDWMRERGPRMLTDTQTKIEFSNGSTIESLPSKSDPARGRSASLIIVDEWAFLENPDEAWASIQPVVDVGGRLIGLSTANGYGNFFHDLWVGATAGTNEFHPMFYPWHANPQRDQAWYEAQKRLMSEWQLSQEFPSTPEEAFLKSGRPVFDLEALMAMEASIETPRAVELREVRYGVVEAYG